MFHFNDINNLSWSSLLIFKAKKGRQYYLDIKPSVSLADPSQSLRDTHSWLFSNWFGITTRVKWMHQSEMSEGRRPGNTGNEANAHEKGNLWDRDMGTSVILHVFPK